MTLPPTFFCNSCLNIHAGVSLTVGLNSIPAIKKVKGTFRKKSQLLKTTIIIIVMIIIIMIKTCLTSVDAASGPISWILRSKFFCVCVEVAHCVEGRCLESERETLLSLFGPEA